MGVNQDQPPSIMKNLIRLSLGAVSALALTAVAHAADAEPGFVDFGRIMPSADGQFVEVNLSPMMLKFVARVTASDEPETANLIGSLKRVRVNVVGLDNANRASTLEKIESIRRTLEAQGWTQIVTVRDKGNGDNVDVHVKPHGEDAIDGLVVTVIDHQGQAVFVNIVGTISPEQIAKVAEKLNIEPLRKLHLKLEQKAKDKEV
jgi:hypothetical protein